MQQRAERLDKAVATSRKKTNKASSAKSVTAPLKKVASTQAEVSQTTAPEIDIEESLKGRK